MPCAPPSTDAAASNWTIAGGAWTLGAWCELRNDFRSFRLDRIVSCTVHDSQFADAPGQRLADYLRAAAEN
jgi:predicted DNA-binding transcriptional regulator YafY